MKDDPLFNPSAKPKSQNLYGFNGAAGYAVACRQMAERIERFPNDTHVVSFNGEEYHITPSMVPAFLAFLLEQACSAEHSERN